MAAPLGDAALALVLREVVARNRVRDGFIYLQVGRGARRVITPFPIRRCARACSSPARAVDPAKGAAAGGERHPRDHGAGPALEAARHQVDLAAPQRARQAGGQGARRLRGLARRSRRADREGASTNAWIVADDGRVLTHPADGAILRGITRTTLLTVLAAQGLRLEERGFTVEEAHAAREALVTGATTLVTSVVAIDGKPIGDGTPGPIVAALRTGFRAAAARTSLGAMPPHPFG